MGWIKGNSYNDGLCICGDVREGTGSGMIWGWFPTGIIGLEVPNSILGMVGITTDTGFGTTVGCGVDCLEE